ncbi:SAV_915 family protein [Parasphingorhabdus pacifica]
MNWDGSPQWGDLGQPATPAVFGSEYAGYESEDAAQTVYLLSQRVGLHDREARIELRQDSDGRLVMLAYSSLEELVRACGTAQPWIAVSLDRVSGVKQEAGAELVFWDAELPSELRHKTNVEEDS